MKTLSPEIGFITSFREFSRDISIRKRAINEKRPILIEDKRAKEFFFLVPSQMYSGLQELYQDWQDAQDLQQELIKTRVESEDWKSVKQGLLENY